jgi:hypothetical protein
VAVPISATVVHSMPGILPEHGAGSGAERSHVRSRPPSPILDAYDELTEV